MIPPRLHAVLDAASAVGLLLGPSALRSPRRLAGPLALAGLGVAAYSLATRYRDEPGKGIGPAWHRLLDAAQGAACLAVGLGERTGGARALLTGYRAFSLAAAALTGSPGPQGVSLPHAAIAETAPDMACLRCGIVNVAFIGRPDAGDRGWFLVDAGIAGSGPAILAAARRRYGQSRPAAILLTHGHFDHVGAVEWLARTWDVPVYAHPLERGFLDGSRSYPPPAPEVGGGLMTDLSPLFPRGPIDLSGRLVDLPPDGRIPELDGWRWIHTPGHTPGHVSFWHEATRSLIAGDAISATQQESLYSAAVQKPRLQGPPAYFTTDWVAAGDSVRRLAALGPHAMIAGHGRPLAGPEFRSALTELARHFETRATPRHSRYGVGDPAGGTTMASTR